MLNVVILVVLSDGFVIFGGLRVVFVNGRFFKVINFVFKNNYNCLIIGVWGIMDKMFYFFWK